jgi:tetratricopeptide (TPR) repeat protein
MVWIVMRGGDLEKEEYNHLRHQDHSQQLCMRWKTPMRDSNPQRPTKGTWSDTEIATKADDRFGFQDYASVLARRAIEADTPLTIGIFGRWGSGKTSLMRLIQDELKRPPSQPLALRALWIGIWQFIRRRRSKPITLETLWINVWQLSNQEELWNAFLQALLTRVHRELPFFRRLIFDGRLLRDRVDLGTLFWQLLVNSYRIVIVIAPLLLALFWPAPLPKDSNQLLALILDPWTGGGASLFLGLWLLLKPIVEAAREKVSLDLGAVLKEAPYEAQVSALQQLQSQFERMVKAWVGENGRLIVFIDDLDRCPPDKIPEVLEALKLFTTTSGCIYVLGLDHDIVRQGIKTQYHFEADAEAVEYLEKIIQIPFHLPPLEDDRIADFVRYYYPDLCEVCPTAPEVFSSGLEPNPRKIKRALNIYRTLLELADARHNAWEMEPIDPELLTKMIVIQSRFRKLHNELVRHPDFLVELETEALANKLKGEKLEDHVRYRLLEQPTEGEEKGGRGLVDVVDLPALDAMLRTGKVHFKTAAADLANYIYLIGTVKGSAELVRPNREERAAFLSNDRKQIQAQVDKVLGRGQDSLERKRIVQVYVQRLEKVVSDSGRHTPDERQSANFALLRFETWLLGNELEAHQRAIDRDSKNAELYRLLSDAYSAQGLYAESDAAYNQAMQLNPMIARLSTHRRGLTASEIAEARLVFDDGLDYSRVFIVENTPLPNWLADIGRSPKPNAFTLGNVCYFPVRLGTAAEVIKRGEIAPMAWLIHELTHQWQYQQMGWRYLVEALGAQLRSGVQAYDYQRDYSSREAALKASHAAGRRLADFNLEQQGDLARDYYYALKTGRDASAWEPFVAEFHRPASPA